MRLSERNQTSQFFDQAAAGWSNRYATDASFRQRLQAILEAAKPMLSAGTTILDFGCGAGDLSVLLEQQGCDVVGTDISAPMLEMARRRSKGTFVQLDTEKPNLPLPDCRFDGCIASSVLEYVPHPHATLTEIVRVLRPGGHLLMTVPDPDHPARRKEAWFQTFLKIPGVAMLLAATRWREGTSYLRISRNRPALIQWHSMLQRIGFADIAVQRSDLPLAVITARKAA